MNQRVFIHLNLSESELIVFNLETKTTEIQVTQFGAVFKLFGNREDRIVSVDDSGLILIYQLNYKQQSVKLLIQSADLI